jgi:hypothetical protein
MAAALDDAEHCLVVAPARVGTALCPAGRALGGLLDLAASLAWRRLPSSGDEKVMPSSSSSGRSASDVT